MSVDIIDQIEADLDELREQPDLIINRCYVFYALHDLPGVSGLDAGTAQAACETIARRCMELLCPPLAVHLVGTEVCLLVHLNMERSIEEVAQAAGQSWTERIGADGTWTGDYSAVSVGESETDDLADAIMQGDFQVLSRFHYEDEE